MIHAHVLHPGRARGRTLRLTSPLSFWGGVDTRGVVVDTHHPQRGAALAGRVLLMPAGRGSSSSSSVLAETIRAGNAPSGIVLRHPDIIVVLGAIVAAELYGIQVPVVSVGGRDFDGIPTDVEALVTADPDSGGEVSW